MHDTIGKWLVITGMILSILGALINNLLIDPFHARVIWALSNPLFLMYFIGSDRSWWNNDHISKRSMIVTYLTFFVTGILSFFI
jgi:hypothetical protein